VLAHTPSTHRHNRNGEHEEIMVKSQKYSYKHLLRWYKNAPTASQMKKMTMFTSKVRFWHHNAVYLSEVKTVDCTQEQRRRLVNGFSDIELRGTDRSGTVPSSLCKIWLQIR
jgi:hypothetical protein